MSNSQGGRAGWEDSSEDLHHLHHLHHLQQHRILAEPSHQIEVRCQRGHVGGDLRDFSLQIRARRPDHPPDHVRVKKNLAGRNNKVGRRRRRLVRKMRLVNDPSTQYDRTNIVRKLVPKAPKVPKQKEELMDAAKWYDNWVPMTLEQYEESYQRIQRRQDRRPPGKVSGRKKPQPKVGPPPPPPPPPKPAARPVLSSFMSAPGPRRPDHPPPGHQDNTKDKPRDKPNQEKNKEEDKPALGGLFVPLSFTEVEPSQEVDLGFSPETPEGNIGDLPVVEEISNDIESFFSSETEPETKPKREYDSNNQISYEPFHSDSDPTQPAGYFTSNYVSPTTAPPSKEISLQPLVQFYPAISVTPTPLPLPDHIFQEQPELSEEVATVPNRRQAFLGHQIPILSQTTEMNQDQAHSFVFE